MNIGIFGGTFDPVHSGHLFVAEEVRIQLKLGSVLFIPAGQPWLKVDRVIAPARHRIAMLNLAIASNLEFQLSTIEVERPGPSYTVDTIRSLQAQMGSQAKFLFILGWDSLDELPQWKEPSELTKMCKFIAIPRQNHPKPDLDSLDRAIPGAAASIILLDMPIIGISSSEIRKRVAEGKSIRYWVPEKVAEYIKEHRLYQ